ncbi:hypothetical protein ILUMI_26346 [Ignelater luminosus]|uniref:Uncharacterized protein n=1 Tax=Ignelater luminosus TaxID=2038154 RepID=A0A8K0C4F6_IGNLU|nr:hypothetical protein ILUMI_26346 [Ignelater luminosus]
MIFFFGGDREQRLQNRAKNKSVQKAVEHVEELPDLTAGGKRYDTIEVTRNLLNIKESSAVFSRSAVEIKDLQGQRSTSKYL